VGHAGRGARRIRQLARYRRGLEPREPSRFGLSKSVLDYVGRDVGMPPGVSDVEAAIDRLSGAAELIRHE
jgi:hypothetical protein